MTSRDVIEALIAIVIALGGYQLKRISDNVMRLMVDMASRVSVPDFSRSTAHMHDKVNALAERVKRLEVMEEMHDQHK